MGKKIKSRGIISAGTIKTSLIKSSVPKYDVMGKLDKALKSRGIKGRGWWGNKKGHRKAYYKGRRKMRK